MMLFEPGWIGAVLRILLAFALAFGGVVYVMVYAERKVSAFIQDRVGPNRVGPFGLMQGLADAIKFAFKEQVKPIHAHPVLFTLGPCLAVFTALFAFAVIPFGAHKIGDVLVPLQVADLNVGILFVLSISSLAVYGIIVGGWASGSKYPLFGALRAAAQMISYEVPLGLVILSVLLLAGSAKLGDIVLAQQHTWYIFYAPLGFLLFVISMFAETNRLPFDMPEGESEIIGYHAEYSAMKFAMFFMAEYANMFTVSCLVVLLFLGGWEFLPFFGWEKVGAWLQIDIYAHPILWVIPTLWFLAKVFFFLFLFVWVRWTLPRFRYDQLMRLGWKRLIPIGLINLLIVIFLVTKGLV